MDRRKILGALGLGTLASLLRPVKALAQQFNLTTGQTQLTIAQYQLETLHFSRGTNSQGQNPSWYAVVTRRDSGGTVGAGDLTFVGPDSGHPTATLPNLITAFITAVGGETGSNTRRVEARVLEFLRAQGYFPAGTLAP